MILKAGRVKIHRQSNNFLITPYHLVVMKGFNIQLIFFCLQIIAPDRTFILALILARRSCAAFSSALAAASAFLLGSTSQNTSQNLTMLMTQAHRPAAANDLFLIKSGSNSLLSRQGRTAAKLESAMFSLSKLMSESRNWSTCSERHQQCRY